MTPGAPANQTIEVTLSLRAREIVSGAAIPVVITLRNTSPSGVAIVTSPEADMPFIFLVEPEKGEKFQLSRDLYLQKTELNTPPPREQEIAPLRAGESLEYPIDLAKIMTAPLKPGRYKITAIYPQLATTYRSAPITIQVVAARARLLEVAPSGNRLKLGSALVHIDEAGAPVLYQRESEAGNAAAGVLRSRRSLREPTSIAISTDAEGATEPRWIAWIAEGKVSLLHVWGDAELYATQAVPLPPGAWLAPHGWTFDDESVMFLAATPAGISLITIQNREAPRVKTFEIGGGVANPTMIRAGFFKTQEKTKEEPPARRLLVAWPDGNRLMCSIINPEGAATPGRVLAEGQLLALDMEAVAREAAPIICAVFSKVEEKAESLVRIRAGEEMQTKVLPPLPEAVANTVAEWTVLAGPAPAVAVRTRGNQILSSTADAPWRTLCESDGSTRSHLRLALLDRAWAVWADGADGLHYLELPH